MAGAKQGVISVRVSALLDGRNGQPDQRLHSGHEVC